MTRNTFHLVSLGHDLFTDTDKIDFVGPLRKSGRLLKFGNDWAYVNDVTWINDEVLLITDAGLLLVQPDNCTFDSMKAIYAAYADYAA